LLETDYLKKIVFTIIIVLLKYCTTISLTDLRNDKLPLAIKNIETREI